MIPMTIRTLSYRDLTQMGVDRTAARGLCKVLTHRAFAIWDNEQYCESIVRADTSMHWAGLFALANDWRTRYLLLRSCLYYVCENHHQLFQAPLPNFVGDLLQLMIPVPAPICGELHFEALDAAITAHREHLTRAREEREETGSPAEEGYDDALCALCSIINLVLLGTWKVSNNTHGSEASLDVERRCREMMSTVPFRVVECLPVRVQRQVATNILLRLVQVLLDPIRIEAAYILEANGTKDESGKVP